VTKKQTMRDLPKENELSNSTLINMKSLDINKNNNFLDNANILFNKLIKENENDKYHDYLKIRNIGGIIVTYNDNNDIKFCTFKKRR